MNPRNQMNDAWFPNFFVEISFDIDKIFNEEISGVPVKG